MYLLWEHWPWLTFHWTHWPLAVAGGLVSATATLAVFVRQLDQIIDLAIKWHNRIRERADAPEFRRKNRPSLEGKIASTRPMSSSNRAILSALTGECGFLCCTSGEWDKFVTSTIQVAVQVSQGMLGADAGRKRAGTDGHKESMQATHFVLGVYAKVHHIWLAEYHDLSESGRRAEFFKLLFADALRRRRCSHRTAVLLAQHLVAKSTKKIATPHPRGDFSGHANNVMCDIIGQVIRRLTDRECLIFLYRVFAEFSEDEIAAITTLKCKTVRAKSRKSMNILSRLAMKQVKVDLELLAIIREAARKEGIMI